MINIEIYRVVGRMVEILLSLLLLFTIFPIVYIVVALMVKHHSPGPAIISRRRKRADGKEYNALVFRVDNENALLARTPQLVNILRGDIPFYIHVAIDAGEPVVMTALEEIEETNNINETENVNIE